MTGSAGAPGAPPDQPLAPPRAAGGPFVPPRWLRGRHVQSVLSSLQPRRAFVTRRARPLLEASAPVVIDCGDDVRLSGHYAANANANANSGDLVVLIHGWEGSADSSYVLSAGAHLYARGHSVFRLNLRDHGDSFHLNPGIFHSCRLAEVVGAVGEISRRYQPARLSLAGFSLGGNFALRVAADPGRPAIHRVVAICPVLDPARTMVALDGGASVYQRYFIRKWRNSLYRKAALWPGLYDFEDLDRHPNLERMTEYLVGAYTEYPTLESYLQGYAITGARLSSLSVASSILAALDDPIIPAEDLGLLARPDGLAVTVTAMGGHCGYMDTLSGPSYADRHIGDVLAVA